MNLDSFLFRQERVGKDGKSFTAYKIRLFEDGKTSPSGNSEYSSARHGGQFPDSQYAEISLLSAIVNHLGINEIPQLYNIVNGDMQLFALRAEMREVFQLLPDDLKSSYTQEKPGLIPGELAFGQVDGTLATRFHLMRLYVEEMTRLEALKKRGKFHEYIAAKALLCLTSLKNRLSDRMSIDLISRKIKDYISDTLTDE